MVSIPVAQEIEDVEKANFRVAVCVVHSETADPPTAGHILAVLRGTERSDPSMSYAIFGGGPKFAMSSDRGSGKIAVYRDRESLRAAIHSFFAQSMRRDLRDSVATYSAMNGPITFGGFEAKCWSNMRADASPRTPDTIVANIAGALPETPNATAILPAMTAPSKPHTCGQHRRRCFPLLTLAGIAMIVVLVVAGYIAVQKRARGSASPSFTRTLDTAPLVGDLMDDLVVLP